METKLQLEATEKHNLTCRLKEEELLILKEMKSYVSFYQRCITELQDAIRGICCIYFIAITISLSCT